MNRIATFFIVLVSIFICGCFEMSEEIWFNDDGSGRMLIELSVSEGLLAMAEGADSSSALTSIKEAETDLKNNPNVEEVQTKEFSEAGMRHLVLDVKVKDYLKLEDIYKSSAVSSEENSDFEAPFEVIELGKGKIRFLQVFSQEQKEAEKEASDDEFAQAGEEFGKAMAAAMFADKYIKVTVHAPKVLSSNGQINEEENTIVWNMPLVEMMAKDTFADSLVADMDCSISLGDRIKNIFK